MAKHTWGKPHPHKKNKKVVNEFRNTQRYQTTVRHSNGFTDQELRSCEHLGEGTGVWKG